MKKRIAITGGIGSGKSTVRNLIKDRGFPAFSCDEIYAELINDRQYIEKITAMFPEVVQNGEIDKKCLSKIVFADATARKRLEDVAHPLIMQKLLHLIDKKTHGLVFAEVPLLFEGGYQNLFDAIIVVVRDKEERIASVQQRDSVSRAEVLSRMNAQVSYDDVVNKIKENIPVYILENKEGINFLADALNRVIETLQS